MTAGSAIDGPTVAGRFAPADRAARTGLALAALAAVTVAASVALGSVGAFPETWNIHLADPINDARRWLINNQTSHWIYTGLLNPLADAIDAVLGGLEALLAWIPWYGYLLFAGLGLWWTRGRRAGLLAVVAVAGFGILEIWDEGLATLALMSVAIGLSWIIGVPLGVLAARSDRAQRVIRPILDAMQTMPGFVYLIPFVLLFGIGRVPAIVSTVIFALPPVVRLTDLGLRSVDPAMLEASAMFGATDRQTLLKVRLPAARPAILVGANQTTNLALSMVVIAALIGAGGLGQIVLRSLQTLEVGQATEAGLGIVAMAIILDRFTGGLTDADPGAEGKLIGRLAIAALAVTVVGGVLGHRSFPSGLTWHFAPGVDAAVDWAQVNLFDIGGSGIGTGPLSDFITLYLVTPLRELMSTGIPWPVMIALIATIGWFLKGWRLAVWLTIALLGVGALGMWELSMDTLAQSLVAVAATLVVGLPLGVAAARSDRFRSAVKPVLDLLQTIPSFVLLVPVIMLFNVGRIPGIIASVLYALPAAIHVTDLGIRSVPAGVREAATSFGSTSRQRLRKVELPLAAPEIMMAVNQVIMLVLAMVVIAGLVGGGGLGLEAVRGLRRSDSVGTGFEAGIAIVLLAGILDRLTRGAADRLRPPPAVG